MHKRLWIITFGLIVACSSANADDWLAFRGTKGDSIAAGDGYATTWAPDTNIQWKVALSDTGNGSPIVSGDHIFLPSGSEDGKKRSLLCFNRKDGKLLWTKTVEFGDDEEFAQNPYCSSTPVSDGTRVVVWHGSAGLYCYDFEGKELWTRDLGDFKHLYGYGSSPIIYQDKVILHCGPGKRSFLTAVELATGKTVWETDQPYKGDKDADNVGSWSTPVIAKVDGADQIIHTTATRLNGYDPKTGAVIWWCDGLSGSRYDTVSSSPMVADGIAVAMSDLRGPAIGVKLGGKGDVTASNRLWHNDGRNPSSVGTGIIVGKHIYRPNSSPGTLECLEAATGEKVWNARSASGNYWSSIVMAGGNLYATNQKGTTVVFKPTPEDLEEVSRNELDEACNSTPAFSNGQIFIRTYDALYCIGK